MRHIYVLILFSILLTTSFGCSSIIRFSDKSSESKKETNYKSEKTKNKTSITDKKELDYNPEVVYKSNIQRMLLEEAESWLGTPYKYGGTDQNGVDCSGLTYNVYLSIGTILPRTAEQQYTYTKRISLSELDVGDLIFFVSKGRVSHVGIYAGNNTMIHSSTSNGVVRQALDSYKSQTIAGYGRP